MSSPMLTRSGQRLLVALLALTVAGCGGKGTDPQIPPADNVAVDSARRTTATVGTAGGTVATTSSSGVPYSLSIPAGALPGDVEIAMAPVITIRDLPFPGEVIAAVSLEPSGLVLLKPAVLTIGTAAALTDSQALAGFSYEGDALAVEPAAAFAAGGAIQIPVSHFSGAGAAMVDAAELREWLGAVCARPTLEFPIALQLVQCVFTGVDDNARFMQFAADYLDQIVTPALNGALGLTLVEAVAEYLEWLWTCDFAAVNPDWDIVLDSRIAAADALVVQKLRDAISAEKTALCASVSEIEHLRSIFEYRHLAEVLELGDEPGVREADIMDGLCAEVVIEEASLSDPLPVGSDQSLDARAALKINGQRVDARFEFLVAGSANLDCGGGQSACAGRANGLGEFTTVVRRTSEDPAWVDIRAILLLPLFAPGFDLGAPAGGYTLVSTPLSGYLNLQRGGAAIEATFPASIVPGDPTTLALQVTEAQAGGTATPVSFAVLTFTADGATVEPSQIIADQDGRAEVAVTAETGARNVTVTISAAVDGVQIASRRVEAHVEDTTISLYQTGVDLLASLYVSVSTTECFVLDFPSIIAPDVPDTTASVETECSFFGINGSGFTSMTHSSNPGLAEDLRSAVMTISQSGTGTVSMDRSDEGQAAYLIFETYGSTSIQFEVHGGPVTFAIATEVEFEDREQENYGFSQVDLEKQDFSFEPNVFRHIRELGDGGADRAQASGILQPGRYYLYAMLYCESVGFDPGEMTHTLSMFHRVTLQLGSAQAVAADGVQP